MTYTSAQAATRAAAKVGKANEYGMCLKEQVAIHGIPGPYGWGGNGKAWAYNYWLNAVKHGKVVMTSDPMKVPKGALLFHAPRPGATTNGGKAGHVATGAGGGYEYSTDQPRDGRWGKVKISAVEKAWGKKLVGYILVTGDGVRLMPDPVPSKPKTKPADWFGIDLRNLAGYDVVHGKATIHQRIPAIVRDIAKVNREIVCVLELPGAEVKNFAARMGVIGYDNLGGTDGRYIFAKAGLRSGPVKKFELKPLLKGDDKQGVGAILYPSGPHPVAVCTAQLENEDASGKTQVGQAGSLMDQFEAWCDSHNIDDSRRFYALDTNSDDRVRTEVFEKRGYVDTFDVAYSSENNGFRSIVKWFGKPTVGKRIDLIAVRKGRPVRRARLRTTTSNLYDHLDQFADIGSF